MHQIQFGLGEEKQILYRLAAVVLYSLFKVGGMPSVFAKIFGKNKKPPRRAALLVLDSFSGNFYF